MNEQTLTAFEKQTRNLKRFSGKKFKKKRKGLKARNLNQRRTRTRATELLEALDD